MDENAKKALRNVAIFTVTSVTLKLTLWFAIKKALENQYKK